MDRFTFCEYCMKETKFTIKELDKSSKLNNENIKYKGKSIFCNKCHNEIFDLDVSNYNLKLLYDEYRKQHNLISSYDLIQIMKQYNIDSESLNTVLDFEKGTIKRYLDGDMVSSDDSDMLKAIKNDNSYYLMLLGLHKDEICAISYNKSKKCVEKLKSLVNTEDKIYSAIKIILSKCDCININTIFILLYYIQGVYFSFTGTFIFEEDFKVLEDKIYLESIKERYDFYGCEQLKKYIMNMDNILSEDENKVILDVISNLGCYSNHVLSRMMRAEAPFILTKKNFVFLSATNKVISKDYNNIIHKYLISAYFSGIKEKYNDNNRLNLREYSSELFDKIRK